MRVTLCFFFFEISFFFWGGYYLLPIVIYIFRSCLISCFHRLKDLLFVGFEAQRRGLHRRFFSGRVLREQVSGASAELSAWMDAVNTDEKSRVLGFLFVVVFELSKRTFLQKHRFLGHLEGF